MVMCGGDFFFQFRTGIKILHLAQYEPAMFVVIAQLPCAGLGFAIAD